MRLIETSHLKIWAASKPAENRFPHLVKALICATIEPDKLRMPSGDAVWLPGFDGVVMNPEKNRFVPTGLSMWELGTDADFRGKANGEYEKRSKDKILKEGERSTQKIDRSKIIFIFATPLVWKGKQDWVDQRKAEGIWQDVIVIDGVDLQDWIEDSPAVNLQFASELGVVPEDGLQTPDHAWDEWSHRCVPPASEELVVVGREEQEKELIAHLSGPPSTFTVRGDSPRDAWGFVLASIRRINSEDQKVNLYSRTVIADNEKVAARLVHQKNLVIILKQPLGQVSGNLSSAPRGCHVIVPEGNDARSIRNVLILPRPTYRQFSAALVGMKLPEEEAERAARSCGRSVTILQRQRAPANYDRPKWAEGPSVIHVLPGLLAGRWDDSNELDRAILCHLSGDSDYGTLEAQLQEFLCVDEPPFQKIDHMWTLTAPVDAFQLLARRLTLTNLKRFKEAFQSIFGRVDPKVEIPPDEWLYYNIRGKKNHSRWLRSGMAETLLLIAERGNDAHINCIESPMAYAERVVRGLPGLNDDWRVLASLRDQYRILIEAAPGPFLDSLEESLEAKPKEICNLFTEGRDLFSGGSMHTGLLWGLEVLAWSPDYLDRVALILAKIARLDPGGRMANRPINTLAEIFLWWHPGTNAPIDQKVAAIDLILNREPDVGWQLLTRLLPKIHSSISHPTVKPIWRDFGELPEDACDQRGKSIYISAIIDRAIDRLGDDSERWSKVLESLRAFSPVHQKKIIALLQDIVNSSPEYEKKIALWKVIRDYTLKHRSFQKSEWALPAELIEKLEVYLPHLAPKDPIEQNIWLFNEWLPDLPLERNDVKHHQQKVKEFREEAVRTIFKERKIEGLVDLGTACKFPGFVVSTAGPLITDISEFYEFVELAITKGWEGLNFAGQMSGEAEKRYGNSWHELISEKTKTGIWPPEVAATLLIWWPDQRATWKYADHLGQEIAAEYWHRKMIFTIEGTTEDKIFQIKRLIQAGRTLQVFDQISHQGEGIPSETLTWVFDSTLDIVAQAQTADQIRKIGINSYEVGEFLDELRKRPDLPREEIARREYRSLPMLGQDVQGLTIHDFMAEDPVFFVEILSDVFPPANRDKTKNEEPSPETRARAEIGFRLLQGMDRIPGIRQHGLDQSELLKWIKAVREKATGLDRTVIADLHIGKILAKSPPDSEDEGWPHHIIRNVIEFLANADIESGLVTERFNMRGVYTKALYEGGAQERALANKYRKWAKISQTNWPRMAKVLYSIAKGWEEDAKREDTRAEQDKLSP